MIKGALQSIRRVPSIINGFSIIEAVMATSVFSLLITALAGSFVYGQQSTMIAGNRARAAYLADECLQAVRNIRDADFANLTDGTYSLATTSNQWSLSASEQNIDIYNRSVIISTIDDDRKEVSCQINWQQTKQRDGSIVLTTYLTNWQETAAAVVNQCDTYCQNQGYSLGICRANANQCNNNGQTHEPGGDTYCTGVGAADTCCCLP